MKLFATVFGPRQSRQRSPQGFAQPQHQTFLLEPILTPSGIIDGVDEAPDVTDITLPDDGIETDIEFDIDPTLADVAVTETDIPETDLEDVAFITELDDGLAAEPTFQFESGYFTVGDSGEVTIDYLFDGGKYQGELAIFSLEGMEDLEPGSEAFIQEAANRALSDSELGHVVISDKADGARFSGGLGERDWNSGDYRGAQTFEMRAGDRFGVMLVPNGRVEAVAENPGVGGTTTPLFSLATANPDDGLQLGQIADVTGDGNTYVFEDMRVGEKADYDYNDLIFQIRGATGETALVDDLIDPDLEWRDSDLGQAIVDIAVPELPEEVAKPIDDVETPDSPVIELTPEMGFLEKPIEVSDGIWFLGGKSPDELDLKTTHSNLNAADTTNTDQLWAGGGLGLNLDGSGVKVGVWDGGHVLGHHQELSGRVSYGDSSSYSDHATHVAGTIGASGVRTDAHGMASNVRIDSFDFNNDVAELEAAAQNGLSLSNHSYGRYAGWTTDRLDFRGYEYGHLDIDTWFGDRGRFSTEDQDFGKYTGLSRNIDAALYDNPNLLSIWSAGNDRDDSFTNRAGDNTYAAYFSQNPGINGWRGAGWYRVPNSGVTAAPGADGGIGGYDTLSPGQTAKNTLVVGAINDITKDPYNSSDARISSFSSFGLADDGRLKVDVVANGVTLTSALSSGTSAYGVMSGTSMSAPNVTGTAALLTQHYQNLYDKVPLSATLKGTIIHTTADVGNVGPDYIYGWGVVDAAAATQFFNAAKQKNLKQIGRSILSRNNPNLSDCE